jgi:hypothetical protein
LPGGPTHQGRSFLRPAGTRGPGGVTLDDAGIPTDEAPEKEHFVFVVPADAIITGFGDIGAQRRPTDNWEDWARDASRPRS